MRKKLMIAAIVLVVALAAIWGGSAIYAAVQNSKASEEFTLTPETSGPAVTVEASALSGTWTIAQGSQAGYRVDEVLNGQNATVVGRTSDVKGQATIVGASLTQASATVGMTSLTTDSTSRDRQFQGIVKTAEFSTSTFTLTKPVDISALTAGVLTLKTEGTLTIAGITKDVTVELTAQAVDDGVEIQGSIPLTFSDFGIQAPNLGFVKVENNGTIEMLLQFRK